jgi:conjugal transfer/type IV secretion protein DotA/TraY
VVVILKIKNLLCQLSVFFVGFFFINELLAFDVPMSDKSRQYLGMIFGGTVGPITLSDEHNIVIGKLFAQLNTVVFVLGTLMVGYITVVSTLNTAKEGHAMGQKWSSMWIPVRSVLGLLVMVPTPISGYSTIQVTVMFFVLQGIGAANSVWQVALDAIGSGLSVTAVKGFTMHPGNTGTEDKTFSLSSTQLAQLQNILQGSFQTAMCSKFVNRFVEMNQSDNLQQTRYANVGNGGQVSFYMAPMASGAKAQNQINIGFEGAGIVNGVDYSKLCGSATIQCHNTDGQSPTDGDCRDSTKIATIYQGLSSVYQGMLAVADTFYSNIDVLPNPLVAGDLSTAAYTIQSTLNGYNGVYETLMNGLQSTIMQLAPTVDNSSIASTVQGAKTLGWIHAGSYYMTLGNLATAMVNSADYNLLKGASDPTYAPIDSNISTDANNYLIYKKLSSENIIDVLGSIDSNLKPSSNDTIPNDNSIYDMMVISSSSSKVSGSSISNFFNKLLISSNALIPHSQGGQSPMGGQDITSSLSKSNKTGITGGAAVRSFQNSISLTSDPLLGIAIFGTSLMYAAEAMVVIAFATSLALSFTSIFSCPVSFKGVTDTLITGVMFPTMSSAILLWSTGATFAVYVPMIPYLMFTATAVGWMFSVIEAMVAAPILALGFVSPSGDELGKAGQGLLMLVGLFMKPTLMILSFILASRLLKAVLTMVNNMFATTIDATVSGVSPLFGWVVPTFIYAGFVISLVNKSFSLIHILPDKVMSWIGVQASGFNPEESVKAAEGKEGISATQSVMKGAGESAQKGYGDKKVGREKATEKAEQKSKDLGIT